MKRLIYAADGLSSKERIKIAKSTTDPRELLRLAHDNSRLVREAVTKNKAITEQVAEVLIDEGVESFNDAAKIALIEKFPDTFCSIFVDDPDTHVRVVVARNTDDRELFAKLAEARESYVRMVVAKNTDDPRLLAKLAEDKEAYVRMGVAGYTDDPKLLAKLADDEDEYVQLEVAENTNDQELLAKLANSKDGFIRQKAQRKLKLNKHDSSKSPEPTQTEWSIPLSELENYSSIESEIDQVLRDSINIAMDRSFPGVKFSYEVTADSYDDNGELIITTYFGGKPDETFTIDLQRLLAVATSSQNKKECVKKTAHFLGNRI